MFSNIIDIPLQIFILTPQRISRLSFWIYLQRNAKEITSTEYHYIIIKTTAYKLQQIRAEASVFLSGQSEETEMITQLLSGIGSDLCQYYVRTHTKSTVCERIHLKLCSAVFPFFSRLVVVLFTFLGRHFRSLNTVWCCFWCARGAFLLIQLILSPRRLLWNDVVGKAWLNFFKSRREIHPNEWFLLLLSAGLVLDLPHFEWCVASSPRFRYFGSQRQE